MVMGNLMYEYCCEVSAGGGVCTCLEDRINEKLQPFKGMKNTPATQAMMAAVIGGVLEEAKAFGEVIPDYDVVVHAEGDVAHVEIRPPRAEPPHPKAEKKQPRGPSTPPDDDWEKRLSRAEVSWCHDQIALHSRGLFYVDNRRAAKIWKSSQMRRFRRIESYGCCGSSDFVAKRWNPKTKRDDIYLLGYNHGH